MSRALAYNQAAGLQGMLKDGTKSFEGACLPACPKVSDGSPA